MANDQLIIERNLAALNAKLECINCHKLIGILIYDRCVELSIKDYFCRGGCGRFYCRACVLNDELFCTGGIHCAECELQHGYRCTICSQYVCRSQDMGLSYESSKVCYMCTGRSFEFHDTMHLCDTHVASIKRQFEAAEICGKCFRNNYHYDSHAGDVVKIPILVID